MMNFETILFFVFVVMAIFQLFYYLFIFRKVNFFKSKNNNFSPPISVVVCGFNEAENFAYLIPKLLEQNYSQFEIVVVNDQSNDDTKFVLKEWEYHPKVKIVTITDDIKKRPGKKFALTLGIKAAKYDYLLLTDADCYPKDKTWISAMSAGFSDQKQIVLGYGAYEKQKGLLNKLVRFDTFQIALQYFSFSLISKTYMGVGRNLAYKKSIFFNNKGFASHLHVPSGDDDLFIREVANEHNTTIAIQKESHTLSKPKESLLSWIKQKTRHFSTSSLYSADLKVLLGTYSLSHFLYWFSFILLMTLSGPFLMYGLVVFFLKTVIQYIIYIPFLKKTEERDLMYLFVILDLLLIISNVTFAFLNVIRKNKSW